MKMDQYFFIFCIINSGGKKERMITMQRRYEVITRRIQGKSERKVAEELGMSRNTVRKYWKDYLHTLNKLNEAQTESQRLELTKSLVDGPTYDCSTRKCRKYTPEIDALLEKILEDEDTKTKELGDGHKQKLTQVQIHSLIVNEGYDIGRSTIQAHINEKRNRHKEAYIKQEYEFGERFEYDFGEVKLMIGDKKKKFYIAVIGSPAARFRWAYLYETSKMDVFLESHVRFFEMIGGCYKEGVYDNMRNVVSKFIGRNEKELNPNLIRLATYYGFSLNVTNCFSGNEKGFVESSVKWVRNSVFASRYRFESYEEAAEYLEEKLKELNKDLLIEKEKEFLTPYMPPYQTAQISSNCVNKYSFITVDGNFYSVPDYLCEKSVVVKKTATAINVYYKDTHVASHKRIVNEKGKTCIDIRHYLNTFVKKPGALRNSTALKSVPELKDIFDTYYKDNPRLFIDKLNENRSADLSELPGLLKPGIKTKQNTNWVQDAISRQLQSISGLFIGGIKNVN